MIEILQQKVLKQKFTDLQGNVCRIVSFNNETKLLKLRVNRKEVAEMSYRQFEDWIKKIMETPK